MFTNVSLTRGLYGNVYTYDAKGNITAIKDLSNQKSAATYDSFDNLLSYVQPGSAATEKYLFTYGTTDAEKKRHLPLTTTTPTGVKTTAEYNAYGSTINATVQENASAPLIRTETEYTEDGNFVTKQRDARSNEVVNTLDTNGKLLSVTDPSGQSVEYGYDASNRVTSVQSTYTLNGEERVSRNEYDQTDRPNETEQRDGDGNLKYRTLIEYDKKNRVKAFNEATADANFKTEYTYDADNRVTKVRYNSSDTSKVDYVYDKLNRITSRTVTNGTSSYATQFAYAPGATTYGENVTAPLVNSITQGEGENAMNFAYTYDNRGNITSETRNGLSTTYVYDALGQFVRVNDPHENATWIYSYDRGGNILNKAKYAYTTADELGEALESIPYTYGDANWKDKLTAYNGVPITYDAIGNPLNDGTWTYEWQAGRQLKRMANIVTGVTMEFAYNDSGVRTKKVKKVNGVLAETTEYLVNGKNIVDLIHIDHVAEVTDRMHFSYDALGEVTRVEHNGTVYTYVQNLQGDIAGILDSNGNLVVKYEYDAWGKQLLTEGLLANVLGRDNPFRYRGYVYDEETGIYYLFNRYYSPEMERWINADRVISGTGGGVLGNNVFAYCIDSPINMSDATGNWPKWLEKAVKVVSVAVVAVAVVTTAVAVSAFTAGTGSVIAVYGASVLLGAALSGINGGIANESNGNSYANGYVGGFFSGAIQSLASWFSGGTIWGGALGSSVGTAVTMALNNADPDSADSSLSEIAVSGLKSGLKALVTSSITAFVGYAVGGVSYKKKILEGAVVNGCNGLMPSLTPAFGEGIKSFFGAVDDALVYAWE